MSSISRRHCCAPLPAGTRARFCSNRCQVARYRATHRQPGPFKDLADQRFACIVADPPWRFESWSAKGTGRSAEQHYPVMSLAAIKGLPVKDLAAKDCTLLLWTVSSLLPAAIETVKSWGFRYVNVAFDWVKITKAGGPSIGMGYYSRTGSEQCLLATRGKPQILSHAVRQVIMEPKREHPLGSDRPFWGMPV